MVKRWNGVFFSSKQIEIADGSDLHIKNEEVSLCQFLWKIAKPIKIFFSECFGKSQTEPFTVKAKWKEQKKTIKAELEKVWKVPSGS